MKPHDRQAGLSLIELMIAVTIGLLLLAGVVTIVTNSSRTQQELENIGRQIENGRYAIELLQREVPHAGYYGEYYGFPEPAALPDPCATAVGDIDAALSLPIQGYDSPAGNPPPGCLGDADHRDGTDILVIRRASTATTAIDALTANELYLQSRSWDHVLATAAGGETAADPGSYDLEKRDNSVANIRRLHTDIYFIGPDDDGVPTLKRLRLTGSGGALAFEEQALVSGIESLQIDYGIDSDGDSIPDAFTTDPGGVADWADVVNLRVHLVVRNSTPTPGHTDTKTYDVGLEGSVGPANDDYRRRAYIASIRAINPSIRRE